MTLTFCIWHPHMVRLNEVCDDGKTISLTISDIPGQYVTMVFENEAGMRAFADRINKLLDDKKGQPNG